MLNIKRIFETIADAGQKILEKKSLKKFSKKRDLEINHERFIFYWTWQPW